MQTQQKNTQKDAPGFPAASSLTALLIGTGITLCLRGYQFGQSNHTVYLLDALRRGQPNLLRNDWFLEHTFQYHTAFAHLSAMLLRIGWLQGGFFAGYVLLALLLHAAWLKIVRLLGGTSRVYLLSVILYYLSAAGFGLGMYDFLQDNCFLPSNIANVAMLWGIAFLISEQLAAAGLCLGLAGMFHLNYALVGVGLWAAMAAWTILRPVWFGDLEDGEGRRAEARPTKARKPVQLLIGSLLLLALCLPNIVPPVAFSLTHRDPLPLSEFVFLYAKFRHTHHYDPASWPIALWISFAWPIPPAILAWRRAKDNPSVRIAARIFLLLGALILVALIGAGIWYISEPLIQMSLFRFSIYVKLLACVGTAVVLYAMRDRFSRHVIGWVTAGVVVVIAAGTSSAFLRPILQNNAGTLAVLVSLMILGGVYEAMPSQGAAAGGRKGLRFALATISLLSVSAITAANWLQVLPGVQVIKTENDSPDYLAVCDWAREHTTIDAVFLVPPEEEAFRLRGERAIVVNFKAVPQFGTQLIEWRKRLCDVLHLPDLRGLPRRFDKTLAAIGRRYRELSPRQLATAARQYGATYVIADTGVTTRPSSRGAPLGGDALPPGMTLVFEKGTYRLYHLAPQ